jgi:hypothetical protein
MTVVNDNLTSGPSGFINGTRFEGQHCQALGIAPNFGDKFYAWDTGYVLREQDGAWAIDHRVFPTPRAFPAGDTFLTESM